MQQTSTAAPSDYATLSYCWGSSLPLRTTKDNLASFTQEIALELMPTTFVDAIHLCRGLGIPHIWIDALCIVQDNEEEWQIEAAHMSKIYRGSQLTITAAQSSDSSHGCFPSNKSNTEEGQLLFRTKLNNADGSNILVRVYRKDIRNVAMSGSIISTRGWTLQEQLLSSRNVFCWNYDIHWKCQVSYQTQTGLLFDSTEFSSTIDSILPRRGLQLRDCESRATWRRIIEGYSRRNFTYLDDRLPAISGIMDYFATALSDAPILGLWANSFARDLAWLRGGGEPQLLNTSKIPSWSWFACRGCVLYNIGNKYQKEQEQPVKDDVKLLSWAVEWHGTAYTSPPTLASVRVKGSVREIPIRPFPEGNTFIPPYLQVLDEDLKSTPRTRIPWRCAGRFDASDEAGPATHPCLLLFSQTRPSSPGYIYETFLILKKIKGDPPERYIRVGLAKIWGQFPTFDRAKTMSLILA